MSIDRDVHSPLPPARWWIESPAPDETLESVLERVSHVYKGVRLTRQGWSIDILPNDTEESQPVPSSVDILRLARMLGIKATSLQQLRVPDAPARLAIPVRRAYCPVCWALDDTMGRPRYFRQAWANVFAFTCMVHHRPLAWVPSTQFPLQQVVLEAAPNTADPLARSTLDLIDEFAAILGGAMFQGRTWPNAWRLSPGRARILVERCLINLATVSQVPLIHDLLPPPSLSQHCMSRPAPNKPWCHSPWEVVRAAGSPAARRVAFWIAAWFTVPEIAEIYRPHGISVDNFVDQEAQWFAPMVRGRGTRMERMRHAMLLKPMESIMQGR